MSELPPPPPNLTPPPGYVAYGSQGAVPYGVQPIGGVARTLGILVLIFVPVQVMSLISTLNVVDKAKDFLNGSISESEFEDSYSAGLGFLSFALLIPVAVLTMIWMFRMAKNLLAMGRTNATFAPGWAIGGWFTPPFVLYVVPWLMMRELWKGSDPDSPAHDPGWKSGKVAPIVNVWWVLYGLIPIIGFVTSFQLVSGFQDLDNQEIAEQTDKYATLTIALGAISAVTAIVYWMLVRQLSARHMKATRETT